MWTKTAVEVDLTDRGSRKGWHYAQVWKSGGGPIGYCAEHEPHDTEREARECFSAWRRDNITLDGKWADWTGCQVEGCDVPTKTFAAVSGEYRALSLCEEHLTVEHATRLLGADEPAGNSMGS